MSSLLDTWCDMRAIDKRSAKSGQKLGETFYSAVAYMATTFVCVWLLKHPLSDSGTSVRAVVSLIPLIPIGFAIRAVIRMVRDGDELERRIDLEALAFAAVAIGMLALTLNLLMSARVIEISANMATVWVLPGLLLTYACAKIWARSRYQ